MRSSVIPSSANICKTGCGIIGLTQENNKEQEYKNKEIGYGNGMLGSTNGRAVGWRDDGTEFTRQDQTSPFLLSSLHVHCPTVPSAPPAPHPSPSRSHPPPHPHNTTTREQEEPRGMGDGDGREMAMGGRAGGGVEGVHRHDSQDQTYYFFSSLFTYPSSPPARPSGCCKNNTRLYEYIEGFIRI